MANEWIMYGIGDNAPDCIHNFGELLSFIDQVGFLPLFRNEISGFSVEEHANPHYWWTDNEERDPWQWRKQASRSHAVAYGKFFGGKAGFISMEWLPAFIAFRRNGYDFEDLWYAGQVQFRQKKIMDSLIETPELPGWELKRRAGFGTGGERNFAGTVTALQKMLFMVIGEFRRRLTLLAGTSMDLGIHNHYKSKLNNEISLYKIGLTGVMMPEVILLYRF